MTWRRPPAAEDEEGLRRHLARGVFPWEEAALIRQRRAVDRIGWSAGGFVDRSGGVDTYATALLRNARRAAWASAHHPGTALVRARSILSTDRERLPLPTRPAAPVVTWDETVDRLAADPRQDLGTLAARIEQAGCTVLRLDVRVQRTAVAYVNTAGLVQSYKKSTFSLEPLLLLPQGWTWSLAMADGSWQRLVERVVAAGAQAASRPLERREVPRPMHVTFVHAAAAELLRLSAASTIDPMAAAAPGWLSLLWSDPRVPKACGTRPFDEFGAETRRRRLTEAGPTAAVPGRLWLPESAAVGVAASLTLSPDDGPDERLVGDEPGVLAEKIRVMSDVGRDGVFVLRLEQGWSTSRGEIDGLLSEPLLLTGTLASLDLCAVSHERAFAPLPGPAVRVSLGRGFRCRRG